MQTSSCKGLCHKVLLLLWLRVTLLLLLLRAGLIVEAVVSGESIVGLGCVLALLLLETAALLGVSC